MGKAKTWLGRSTDFLTRDIWRIRASSLPRRQSFLLRQARVVVLAVRGFHSDKCLLRASALTLYTLVSVVPVLAMAFGVAKGFGFEELLQQQLAKWFSGQQEVVDRMVGYAHSLLSSTSGGLVAGIGAAILFFTVVKVFSNIEKSFNDIWGIPKGRSWFRKCTDYLSMMVILPVLLVVAGTATAIAASRLEAVMSRLTVLGPAGNAVMVLLGVLPYGMMWIVFLVLYIFMPNTKVNFRSALLAAVVAGTTYQVVQWFYIAFQIGVTRYSAIYGGFAALPLFIMWVQVSWVVVLLGAEIAFAHQHVATYEFEPDCLEASTETRKLVALAVMHHEVKNFVEGKRPETAQEIAAALEAPFRLVSEMCYELTEAGLLAETKRNDPRLSGYLPARDIQQITVASVLEALDKRGSEAIPLTEGEGLTKLRGSMKELREAAKKSPGNALLRDI